MSLPVPLTVRLSTARGDAHITGKLRDLSFRTVAPGGFASITLALDQPLTDQADYLDYYGRCIVHDARTGAVVCEGRVEDPGRSAGRDGQVWDVTAVGPAGHAKDRNVPLIYIDRRIEDATWPQVDLLAGQPKSSISRGDGAGGVPSLKLSWETGQSIGTNHLVTARYIPLQDAGQWVARIAADHTEGGASANLRVQLVARFTPLPGVDTVWESDAWTTGNSAMLQRYGVEHTDKAAGVDIRIINTGGAAFTAGSTHWSQVINFCVTGSRYTASGAEVLSGYAATVLAHEVVGDLLGRLLTQYDGAGASIAITSYAIDQLAYPDGVDPHTVLDDLMTLEPAYLWEALEANTAGKYRFLWRTWPTSVRYEADVTDGYDAPSSADGLYNAVTVRWKDVNGRIRSTRLTQAVPQLTAAGLTREPKPLDLGDNAGSLAAATQAGQQFLADHRYPRNAGMLRISGPILDTSTGMMVSPWEIRPGYLIRVRGVLPRVDALNPPTAGRDGVTIFKIVAVDFRASDATATLELDSYTTTTARALAELMTRPKTRRR